MPSFWEKLKKPVVSAGMSLVDWLRRGVQWKPPGYVSSKEQPEIAKPIETMPRDTAPSITTTLGKLFRGEEIQMIRPGSALERVAKAQAAAREEITEKIGKPIAEKLVTAPREFVIPAIKGFLGEPIYKRILEPVVPEAMREPKGKILPAVGTIAGWMTAFGAVSSALGKLMTSSKIGQTLVSHLPRISRAIQIAGAGLTLDQAQAPLEATFEERRKIFTTGLPRWVGWGVAGMIAPAKVYAWLPTIFGTQYASAKLEGQSNQEAFKDALTMAAIFSLFKIADLPKSPQQILRDQAFKKLGLKPKASADEVKKAYRVLAHKYHPDRPGGDAVKFKVIADANKILDTTPRQFQKDIFTEIRDFYKFLRSPEGKKMALMIVEEMPIGARIKAVKPGAEPAPKDLKALTAEAKKFKSAKEAIVEEWQDQRAMGGGEPYSYIRIGKEIYGRVIDAELLAKNLLEEARAEGIVAQKIDESLILNPKTGNAVFDTPEEATKALMKDATDFYTRVTKEVTMAEVMPGVKPAPKGLELQSLDKAAVDLFIKRQGKEAYESGEIGTTLERIDQKVEEYDPEFLKEHPEIKGHDIMVYHDPLAGEDWAVVDTTTNKVVEIFDAELRKVIKEVKPIIPKELEPLAVEARKYKSAEEFIETQKRVFRGGKPIVPSKVGVSGIPVSLDKDIARVFGKPFELFITKNAKILSSKDIPQSFIKEIRRVKGYLQPTEGDKTRIVLFAGEKGFDVVDLTRFGEKEMRVINSNILKTKQELTDLYTQAIKEVKPAPKAKPVTMAKIMKPEVKPKVMAEVFKPEPEPEVPGLKEYEREIEAIAKESERQLFKDIKELGGIKSYKEGFLAEELRPIPLTLRNNKTGSTLDEVADMLKDMGYNYESDTELLNAILDIQSMARPVAKRKVDPTLRVLRTITKTAPEKTAKISRRLLNKLYRLKYPKVPATLKAARRAVEKGVIKEIPAELIVRRGKGFVLIGETVEAAPEPPAPATTQQIKLAHVLAKSKAMIGAKGKMKPQYRALAKAMTGKTSMKSMTEKEASDFINALKKLPEPYYIKGKLIPPSISRVTKLVPKGFFEGMKFKEPTVFRYLTPQTYYSQILGVKPLVEPLELAKQRFDLVYRDMANGVDKMIKAVDEIGKTTAKEKIKAKIKNIPTKAVKEMRNLLNDFEEAPADLLPAKKEIFNWFRSLTQETWKAENQVRAKLDLPLIEYRRAYVRHTSDALAQEMLQGRYPFPEGLKYWSQKIVGKKIFNPMELHRKLADDLEELWTKDLSLATKSMLWIALKEIHLSQPLKFFNEQLGTVSKDPLVYKNLTPEEQDIYSQIRTMPASTKKWLVDYVNQVIKGQETWLDTQVNNVVTKTGLKGLLNKVLAPFGRTVGRKPVTKVFQITGRAMIHGVMGPLRPRQLIRNKFQLTQNLALYTLKANLKGFYPASIDKNLKSLMTESLFLKTYTGFEELPTNIQGKLEKLNLALFQWTAMSNVAQGMKVAYWDTLELITDPKYKDFGWADPERIRLNYNVREGKLYPSEREKLIKEMEFGASATQYHYIPMGMPEVFRHKTLIPLTRLQSWWMNYFFKFNREAITRVLKGETGYGAKLPWSRRLGWFRYLVLGGLILNTLGYERSYLWGAVSEKPFQPPSAQFMIGLYTYLTTLDDLDEDWAKRKNAQAKNQMYYSIKTFVPGYLAWKDFMGLWSGKKSWKEYFFYTKGKKKKKPIQVKPIGGKTMGEIFKPTKTKRILESPILGK